MRLSPRQPGTWGHPGFLGAGLARGDEGLLVWGASLALEE